MAFGTEYKLDPQKVRAGERHGTTHLIDTVTEFEDGLLVGRFAKFDDGSLDNLDASGDPVIAGVVLRNVASPVEDLSAIDASLYGQVDYARFGYVTVSVVDGQEPEKFGQVFAQNADTDDRGKALAAAGGTGVAVNAEFVRDLGDNVWLIALLGREPAGE